MLASEPLLVDLRNYLFNQYSGECGHFVYDSSCHENASLTIVEELCVGQQYCEVDVSDTNFGDPCYGTVKWMAVEAECSNVDGSVLSLPTLIFLEYDLAVTIPSSSDGEIHVSKLDFSNLVIQEDSTTFWSNGASNSVIGSLAFRKVYNQHFWFQ